MDAALMRMRVMQSPPVGIHPAAPEATPPANSTAQPIPPEAFHGSLAEFRTQGGFVEHRMPPPPAGWKESHIKKSPPMPTPPATPPRPPPQMPIPSSPCAGSQPPALSQHRVPIIAIESDTEASFRQDVDDDVAPAPVPNAAEAAAPALKAPKAATPAAEASKASEVSKASEASKAPETAKAEGKKALQAAAREKRHNDLDPMIARIKAALAQGVKDSGLSEDVVYRHWEQDYFGLRQRSANRWNDYQKYANSLVHGPIERRCLDPNFVVDPSHPMPPMDPALTGEAFKLFKDTHPENWEEILATFLQVSKMEKGPTFAQRQRHFENNVGAIVKRLKQLSQSDNYESILIVARSMVNENSKLGKFFASDGVTDFSRVVNLTEDDLVGIVKTLGYHHQTETLSSVLPNNNEVVREALLDMAAHLSTTFKPTNARAVGAARPEVGEQLCLRVPSNASDTANSLHPPSTASNVLASGASNVTPSGASNVMPSGASNVMPSGASNVPPSNTSGAVARGRKRGETAAQGCRRRNDKCKQEIAEVQRLLEQASREDVGLSIYSDLAANGFCWTVLPELLAKNNMILLN
ncbi:hypothetical protein B0H19DRAFT_1252315 [Mycena capillaripes]|nr:hypothetical protein B0H19DRAFT_1252315 [Mycena capillaripes]